MPRDDSGRGPFGTGGGTDWKLPPWGQSARGVSRIIAAAAGLVLLFVLVFTTYYQVEPDEVGVVQRFGAYVRTTEPGPHFRLPLWIETVTKVPVQRQLKVEFGFRTVQAGIQSRFASPSDQTAGESIMLTGDLVLRRNSVV